jgi:hypothetical protein
MLLVLLGLYFGPVLTGAKSLYARDLFNFHYPLWATTAKPLQQFHIPCWNPLSNFGQSISGNRLFVHSGLDPAVGAALNIFIGTCSRADWLSISFSAGDLAAAGAFRGAC